MPPRLIGCAPENMRAGRPAGLQPTAIVVHRSGTSDSLRARFHDPISGVSAHYVVAVDGAIEQYVDEVDTAFHTGLVVNASWTLLRPTVNPNFYTIGIELAGAEHDDWPDAQVLAAGALIAGLAARWDIPLDRQHIIPHHWIRSSSRCPASHCPLERVVAAARDHHAATYVPRRPIVRTLTRANLRHGVPSRRAAVIRVLDAGVDVAVTAFTDEGEPVNGNPYWYRDEAGGFLWAGATDVANPVLDHDLSTADQAPTPTTDAMDLLRSGEPAAPAAGDAIPIDRRTFALAPKEFFPEVTRKDLVVLHFTAGTSARSAFETWRRDPAHIATAYIVDVDGAIYEVFPPSHWAAHLGVKGTNYLHDRRSIGIEIANVGPLQADEEDPAVLNWWPRKSRAHREFTTRFCHLDETDRYVAANFRGKRHFAAYPQVQVAAVASLLRQVCEQFAIPLTLPSERRRYECDVNAFTAYKGVCSHANFRPDKWDIGPAFPWDQLGV